MRASAGVRLLIAVFLFASAIATPAHASGSWDQRGETLLGSVDSQFGRSVALSDDGTILAVGANNANGGDGQVSIYAWNGAAWQLRETLSGEGSSDEGFGFAVALSSDGSTLVVGAPFHDDGNNDTGRIQIYTWDGSAYQSLSEFVGMSAGYTLGFSVDVSADGTIFAIGIPGYAGGSDPDPHPGSALVVEWNGSALVQLGGALAAAGTGEEFGASVSLNASGYVLGIGDYQDDASGTDAGAVYAYQFDSGSDSWQQRGSALTGAAAGNYLGFSVAVSADGSALVAGAPNTEVSSLVAAGSARSWTWDSGTSSWQQRGSAINGSVSRGYLGWSVATSADGSMVAAGVPRNGTAAGLVSTFTWGGASGWQARPDVSGSSDIDFFGWSIALTPAGNVLAAGALGDGRLGNQNGAAYVFTWSGVSTGGAYAEFTYSLPDGRECTSISPQRLQVGTMVQLPGETALCQTMDGSLVAGWVIPVPQDFTGFGSASEPFPPGLPVRVTGSQRFTLVPFEPILTIEYDANIGIGGSCNPADVDHVSDDGRIGYSWVPRADFAMARAWDQAPCTPEGHELVGWNTAGDGTGESIEVGASLPVGWETSRVNERRLFAMWQAL